MSAKEREGHEVRSKDNAKVASRPEGTGRDWGLILFLSAILIGLLGVLGWLVKVAFR